MSVGRGRWRRWALAALAGSLLGCASGAPPAMEPESAEAASPRRARVVEAEDGDVLVVLRETLDRPTAQVVERLARRHRLTPRAAWPMRSLGRDCLVFDALGVRVDDGLLRRIEADPAVESAQRNAIFEVRGSSRGAQPAAAPSGDPHADLQTSRRLLRLDAAHRRSTGRGVRIAIVDTGAELDHPDLRGRVAEAKTFVAGDQSFASDRHGTAVAGVVGAARGNGVGIVGVAPDSALHLLKACWYPRGRGRDDPTDPPAVCSSYTVALALDHAIEARLEVVNLSLGGPPDPLLRRLVEAGAARDMVFVAPAPDPERPGDGFLAGSDAAILTAAIPAGDDSAPITGVLYAPGHEVLTTVPGGGFDFVGGWSMASAHVAGVAALLLEGRVPPSPRVDAVREILARTSSGRAGSPARVVDACAALAARDAGAPGDAEASFVLDCDAAPSAAPPTPPSPS